MNDRGGCHSWENLNAKTRYAELVLHERISISEDDEQIQYKPLAAKSDCFDAWSWS